MLVTESIFISRMKKMFAGRGFLSAERAARKKK